MLERGGLAVLHGADSRHDVEGPDVYLTNGVFLYRLVEVVATGPYEVVELEDCYRLDVVRVPASELRARRLRVVTPAPADG